MTAFKAIRCRFEFDHMLTKKNLTFAALLLSAFCFVSSASGQRVLVDGDPPLTEGDFESIVEYYEHGLEVRFSDGQRNELQEIVSRQWKKGQRSDPKYLSAWLVTISKINGISGEKRERIKDKIRDAVLGDLRDSRGSELSRFMLGVYENAADQETNNSDRVVETSGTNSGGDREPRDEKSKDPQPIQGTLKLSDLAGTWGKATTATYGYHNTVTNDYRSGYGAANQHDIYPNGMFDYTNYAQVSGYGCTTELYTSMKGRISIRGSQVTFTYSSGTVRVEDSCKKSSVTRPAQISPATFRAERVGNKLRLCEVGKENPTCLDKAEN